MITIIDYGLGNIKAFKTLFKNLNIPCEIASTTEGFNKATSLILPGVGSFDYAMNSLNNSGLRPIIEEKVLGGRTPVLGVCVGMQMLSHSSEEGSMPGLSWIPGKVKKFNFHSHNSKLSIPHMGWNNLVKYKNNPLLSGLDENSRFYFLHSYYFDSDDEENVIARSFYGEEFVCAVNFRNIYGVQFHPEKSHKWGIQILKNFSEI